MRNVMLVMSAAALAVLSGCAPLSIVSVPAAAVNIGSMAYRALESADISIAMDPEATRDEWNRIHRIALWMGQENPTSPYGRIGDLGAVVADNLALELMSRGFSVYGHDRMPESGTGGDGSLEPRRESLLFAARSLDAQVIITGNVAAAHIGSLGFPGGMRATTVVQSLSLTVIDVATGRTLMILTIDYRAGQPPRVVAEGAATILKAKRDDPKADIKTIFSFFRTSSTARPLRMDRRS